MNREAALVVFSGGQDSTTCLFWAKRNFKKVYALSFLYAESLTQTSRGNDGLSRGLPGKSVLAATGFFGLPPLGHTSPNASVLNTKNLNIYLNIKEIKTNLTLSNPIIRLHEVCTNQGLTPNFRVISLLFLRAECGSTCCGILHSD